MGCGNQSNEDLTRRIEVLQAEHAALEATVDSIKTNLKSQTEVSQMLLELIKKSNGDQ
jgi:prefoldin subunit 5